MQPCIFFFIFFMMISSSSAFHFHHFHFFQNFHFSLDHLINFKHELENNLDITNGISNDIELDSKTKFIYDIVRKSSNILPNVDSIGHHVLQLNNMLINKVLDNKFIDYCQKKKIILEIINLTRKGDDTGSFILQTYYDLIDKLM